MLIEVTVCEAQNDLSCPITHDLECLLFLIAEINAGRRSAHIAHTIAYTVLHSFRYSTTLCFFIARVNGALHEGTLLAYNIARVNPAVKGIIRRTRRSFAEVGIIGQAVALRDKTCIANVAQPCTTVTLAGVLLEALPAAERQEMKKRLMIRG